MINYKELSVGNNDDLSKLSNKWLCEAIKYKYSYNFTWLGRPIIQIPQDIYAMQELIWKIKPDLIIETGIAHGGSLIMSASMLALIDYCEGYSSEHSSRRKVIGIDTEIRSHNRTAIENHPLSHKIKLIEGSSVDSNIIKQIKEIIYDYKLYEIDYFEKMEPSDPEVIIFLDSNHTHEHVLQELNLYTPFISVGSYCVVWDSGLEELPEYMLENSDKPWRKGNNPKTAVHEFLKNNDNFMIDKELENKLQITSISDGFLRRIK